MRKRSIAILVLIIVLSGCLRLYKLDKFPPSLFGDEVDVGYQAYSILKTGKDYMGQPWPISFHSLADWRTPLFLYATVPFVAIFGLNEWGVRLPSAIFGILTIPFFFLLIRKLFKNDNLGLAGAFCLAVSMWHLQYSRAAFEVTQMLFLIIGGVYFFLKGLEKWKFLFLSVLFFALSPYSYNTAKFFLPFFILLLLVVFWKKIREIPIKRLLLVSVFFMILMLPMAFDIFFGKAGDRFSILSIFTDPTTIPQIGFDRQVDMGSGLWEIKLGVTPSLSSRFFHNKFVYWGMTFTKNYFNAFSTNFLFTFGDINYRHSIQGGFGQLYWLDAVFLLLGLFYLLKEKDKNQKLLVLGWLLLAPVPSALTRDGANHATRLILMLPPLLIICSYGIAKLFEIFKKQKILLSLVLCSLFIIQFLLFSHRYYIHYPKESEDWWHYGFKQMALFTKENESKYDYVIFSDRSEPPLIFSLFWLKVDPKIFQENKLEWVDVNDAIKANHLLQTKYYFGHVSESRIKEYWPKGTLTQNILYLTPESEVGLDYRYHKVTGSIKLLETVYSPSGRAYKYALTGE